MSSYFLRKAYERGLKGEKPHIVLGEHLFDAQMEGYKQYRQNLADAIAGDRHEGEEREEREEHRSSHAVGSAFDERATLFVLVIVVVFLVWWVLGVSR